MKQLEPSVASKSFRENLTSLEETTTTTTTTTTQIPSQIKCPYCAVFVKSPKAVFVHAQKKHDIGPKQCPFCDLDPCTEQHSHECLNKYIQIYTITPVRKDFMKCVICFKLETVSAILKHLHGVHNLNVNQMCHLCNKSIKWNVKMANLPSRCYTYFAYLHFIECVPNFKESDNYLKNVVPFVNMLDKNVNCLFNDCHHKFHLKSILSHYIVQHDIDVNSVCISCLTPYNTHDQLPQINESIQRAINYFTVRPLTWVNKKGKNISITEEILNKVYICCFYKYVKNWQ
jgi:hypothetical protein